MILIFRFRSLNALEPLFESADVVRKQKELENVALHTFEPEHGSVRFYFIRAVARVSEL